MRKKRPSFLVVLAAILFFLFPVNPLFGFEEELLTPTMSVSLEEPTEEPAITEAEISPVLEETPVSSPVLSPAAFFEEEALPASNAAEAATISGGPSPEATAETASQATVSPAAASVSEEAPPKKSELFSLWNDLKRFLRIRTLSLTEKDFQADEKMKINLRDYKAAELRILVFDRQGKEVEIIAEEDEGDINISPQKTLQPGRYTLRAFEGEELVLEENFTWGVLAINTHKSIYQPQETAKLAIAVLDEEGIMVCDAKVELRIKSEKQAETLLSTDEGTIKVNPECRLHGFTLKPDYEAEYQVGEAGVYQMELTAETKNGRYTVNDSFEVKETVPFEVERASATRIYPPASYPVVFKIKANQDFKGEIVEIVPQDFEIIAPADEATPEFRIEENDRQEEKLLIWSVDWREGETRELSYQFKAPDISPQFYLLGPLAFRQTVKKINLPEEALEDEAATFSQQIDPATQTIADPLLESSPAALAKESVNVVITEEIVVFQEARRWQLAIDASQTQTFTSSGSWQAPAGVTQVTVECWGGGGGGGPSTNKTASSGGGGGAYSKKTVSVTGGNSYSYTVGGGGAGGNGGNGSAGGDTYWVNTSTVLAKGGSGGSATTPGGAGGAAASGVGETKYSGGNGSSRSGSSSGAGGGGAGSTGNGGNASGTTAGTGTSENGGNGGAGRTSAGTPYNGSNYGGGGGGNYRRGSSGATGGNGAPGLIRITYELLPPSSPTNVSATDGTYTDKVVVTWTKSTGATGYKVYEGSNLLDTLGDVATYDDTAAPAPTITAGSASASDGTSADYVALSLSGQSANNGSSRTYKVVAFNGAGDSPDSNTDNGYRGVGSLTYQWQRSAADADASYSDISGATTASYNDTGAPANGDGRYYRCVLNATGASQQTSTADRGYRQAPPAQLNQKSYRWRNDDGGEGSSDWYSQDWDYRKPVAITNSNEVTLENFQVQVSLDTSTLITNNKMKSDCADIRFTDSDKKTLINYWIESGCNTTDTKIWVKIPSIPTAGKNIYLYYGNSSASSTADGEAVFDLFDDFLGTSLDTDKWRDWNPQSFGNLEVADGLLKISGTSDGSTWKNRGIFTNNTLTFPSAGSIIEINHKWNLANQYSGRSLRLANSYNITDGTQWRLEYIWWNFLNYHDYRFVIETTSDTVVTYNRSLQNDSPTNFEIERYVWHNVGGQAQVATRSTDGGDSFTSLWNAADSSWSLPASRYLGYVYSNRQTTSGGYAYLDWIRIRKYASSQPGASPGTEESQPVGGGASWKAVENTAVSDIEKNKNIRLRFSINNSGGQNATASFRLQVAPKGEAANCEAVLSANFADVPTATGSAVAVMTTSANFTDQDATTAQLTASATTFVAGKMVSYPSNQAGSLTLGGDRYTEVEYNFQMTNNAAASTTYCFRVNNAGTALDSYDKVAALTTKAANQAPNAPTSLVQKKTDDTSLAVGAWTNETGVKFSATVSDPDSSDTLYLCVEKDILGTSFSGSEDLCGSGVAYSGTAVEATVTISGITDANQYHWQARVKDGAGAYSSWASFGGNSESEQDFGVDTSPPGGGTVYDGEETGVDKSFNNGSLSQLSANWANFNAGVSGLDYYQYAIGTGAGGTDVKTWTSVGTSTAATATDLTLITSTPYYFSVRAVDKAGNIQSPAISSNGQLVAPSLIFSVSPDEVSFTNLNAGNDYTDSKTVTLTTSTNAYNGYLVRAFITDYLRSVDNAFTIADFDGGTYEAPDEWLTGDRGFGYHSSDTLVQGTNKFNSTPCPGGGNPPCFAPFSHSGPGEVIADHTANVSGAPISNEEFTITLKVKTNAGQPASTYSTNIIYTITAKY